MPGRTSNQVWLQRTLFHSHRQGLGKVTGPALNRAIALDGHAEAGPDLGEVVPDSQMLDGPVIPDGDGVRAPTEPYLEVRLRRVVEQEIQQRPALILGNALDALREAAVDEQRLASGDRMRADDRVRGARVYASGFRNADLGIGGAVARPARRGMRSTRQGRSSGAG